MSSDLFASAMFCPWRWSCISLRVFITESRFFRSSSYELKMAWHKQPKLVKLSSAFWPHFISSSICSSRWFLQCSRFEISAHTASHFYGKLAKNLRDQNWKRHAILNSRNRERPKQQKKSGWIDRQPAQLIVAIKAGLIFDHLPREEFRTYNWNAGGRPARRAGVRA